MGDIVPGTVTASRDDGVDLDLGGGAVGVVPRSELVGPAPEVGASIEGKVIRRQGGNGRLVLSPRRAQADRAWTAVQAAFEQGSTVTGKVKEAVKGGYLVDLGLRAFLPESLVDVRRGSKLQPGEEVEVAVIECERPAGRPERVVVDRRQVRERTASLTRDAIVAQLAVGQRARGRVTAVTNFGAFVDLGGAEGLIHVSQLAHRPVTDPREVVQVGQEVDVVVVDIRRERGKVALSRKAALPDPFSAFQGQHGVGDLVYGTVTSLAPFGAFIAIDGPTSRASCTSPSSPASGWRRRRRSCRSARACGSRSSGSTRASAASRCRCAARSRSSTAGGSARPARGATGGSARPMGR